MFILEELVVLESHVSNPTVLANCNLVPTALLSNKTLMDGTNGEGTAPGLDESLVGHTKHWSLPVHQIAVHVGQVQGAFLGGTETLSEFNSLREREAIGI